MLAVQELNEKSEVTVGKEERPVAGGARRVVVRMKAGEFHPSNVSLRGGQTVRWVNADDTVHTVTSLPSSEAQFDSGRLAPRDTFDESFTDIGVYRYESETTGGMQGKVTVLGD